MHCPSPPAISAILRSVTSSPLKNQFPWLAVVGDDIVAFDGARFHAHEIPFVLEPGDEVNLLAGELGEPGIVAIAAIHDQQGAVGKLDLAGDGDVVGLAVVDRRVVTGLALRLYKS